MSIQMDAEFNKEQIGTLFVWVGGVVVLYYYISLYHRGLRPEEIAFTNRMSVLSFANNCTPQHAVQT
jgi:hypothetical protein